MNWYRLKTCIKCQGDLAADEGDWICLQCGTYYYTGLYQLPSRGNDSPPAPRTGTTDEPGKPSQKMAGVEPAPMFAAPRTATMAGAVSL